MPSNEIPNFYQLYLSEEQLAYPCISTVQALEDLQTAPENSIDGITILDCFWQTEEPLKILDHLQSSLKPGASAIFIEPLLSPVSYLVAKFKYPNQLKIHAKPFEVQTPHLNFATSSLIFDRIENRIEFMKRYPQLTFSTRERIDLGAGRLNLSPYWLKKIHKLDTLLMPFLGNFSSFHMKVILTKRSKLPYFKPK